MRDVSPVPGGACANLFQQWDKAALAYSTIFLIVILAAQLDRITGNAAGVFRTSTAFFFIANDALSVLENVGEMGVKLPAFLTNALTKFRDENEGAGDGNGGTNSDSKPE